MGPQAWASVGRAMTMALAKWALDPNDGGAGFVISQIKALVMARDFKLAKIKLMHLKRHHSDLYEDFIQEFGDDLDDEAASYLRLRS